MAVAPKPDVVEQLLLEFFDEVRIPCPCHDAGRRCQDDSLEAGVGGLGRRDVPLFDHLVENDLAPADGLLGVGAGIGGAGCLDERRQQTRFGQGELVDILVEVVGGSGADAVGTVTQIDGVEVALEDLLLGETLLEPHRQGGLFELPIKGSGVGEQDVLQVLLGDGAAALHDFAGFSVGFGGSDDGAEIDAGVVPVAFVFDGYDGVDEMLGDVVVDDQGAVFPGVPMGEHRTVRRVHDGCQRAFADAGVFEGRDGQAAGTRRHGEYQHPRNPA